MPKIESFAKIPAKSHFPESQIRCIQMRLDMPLDPSVINRQEALNLASSLQHIQNKDIGSLLPHESNITKNSENLNFPITFFHHKPCVVISMEETLPYHPCKLDWDLSIDQLLKKRLF
jgi:hypothetical protein